MNDDNTTGQHITPEMRQAIYEAVREAMEARGDQPADPVAPRDVIAIKIENVGGWAIAVVDVETNEVIKFREPRPEGTYVVPVMPSMHRLVTVYGAKPGHRMRRWENLALAAYSPGVGEVLLRIDPETDSTLIDRPKFTPDQQRTLDSLGRML